MLVVTCDCARRGRGPDDEPALDLAQPRARGKQRSFGLAALLGHPLELRELGPGGLQRSLRLVVLRELLLELRDPLACRAELRGQPATLLQRLVRIREPRGLGTELDLGRA